jgi:NDP-sugar pyrophosphorylase family protein
MKGLILAAGLGSRLKPFTDHAPKPLVPIFDRPCISYLIEWLAEAGIVDVAINTHWLPEPLHAALGDGAAFGVRLHWQHEADLLDGMGTVKSFEWLFGDGPVVCVNGDIVLDTPLAPLMVAHRDLGAALTLLTVPYCGPPRAPVSWGTDGRLRGIRRTGHDDPRGVLFGDFGGVHVIEPVVWREYIPKGMRYHLITELWPRLRADNVPVVCHLCEGLCADVGSPAQLDAAHALVLQRRSVRYLYWADEVSPGVWVAEGAVCEGEVVPPVWLGQETRLERGARLGPYGVLPAGQVMPDGASVAYGLWDPAVTGSD